MRMATLIKRAEQELLYWSWVILFLIACIYFYESALKKRDREYNKLYGQLQELQTFRDQARQEQKMLLWQINSQSDPAWIELTLMKVLGVVPEGQTKVYFREDFSLQQ